MAISREEFDNLSSDERVEEVSDVLYNTLVDGENASKLWQDAPQTVTLRNGDEVDNLRKRLESIGFFAEVEFESGLEVNSPQFTVTYNDEVYSAKPSEVPFTTTSTFDPNQWKRPSFLEEAEAAADTATSLVNGGSFAYEVTLNDPDPEESITLPFSVDVAEQVAVYVDGNRISRNLFTFSGDQVTPNNGYKWPSGVDIVVTARSLMNAVAPDVQTLSNGSAATPSLRFSSDQDTGIYRNAANELGFSTQGVERMVIKDTEVDISLPIQGDAVTSDPLDNSSYAKVMHVGDFGLGSTDLASVRFDNGEEDLPSGFYSAGGSSSDETTFPDGTRFSPFLNLTRRITADDYGQTRIFFSDNYVYVRDRRNLSEPWTLQHSLLSEENISNARDYVISSGSETEPGLSIQDDSNSGLFSPSDNQLSVTLAGFERHRFVTNALELHSPDGGLNDGELAQQILVKTNDQTIPNDDFEAAAIQFQGTGSIGYVDTVFQRNNGSGLTDCMRLKANGDIQLLGEDGSTVGVLWDAGDETLTLESMGTGNSGLVFPMASVSASFSLKSDTHNGLEMLRLRASGTNLDSVWFGVSEGDSSDEYIAFKPDGRIRSGTDLRVETANGEDALRVTQQKALEVPILSADPDDPPSGFMSIWVSDGTGTGNDGDLILKDSSGSTRIV